MFAKSPVLVVRWAGIPKKKVFQIGFVSLIVHETRFAGHLL